MAASEPNVVMTRTFSKIHGLASLRIGWAYAHPEICDALNRIRGAFNVNLPAIEAGVAAMEDQAHEDAAVAHNAQWLGWLTDELRGLGLDVVPSVGNFLLVGFPRTAGRTAAEAVRAIAWEGRFLVVGFPKTSGRTAAEADTFLAGHGLILRAVASYGLPDHLRLTVGTEEANRLVVDTLKRFMTAEGRRG